MHPLAQIAVIIPAYQPEARLVQLVRDMGVFPKIFVVNDGSSPERAGVFAELAKIPGVTVLAHAVNLGKGAALKTAFNHILVHEKEVKGVVTVDADGQHLPKDVRLCAEAFLKNPESLVLGVRQFSSQIPFRSQFGNVMTKFIFQFLVGKKISDTQTGLRVLPASFLPELIVVKSTRYDFELDMLVMAAKKLPILEVPITTVYEDGNKSSHFNPVLDSFRIYFVFGRFVFVSLLTFLADFVTFTLTYQLTKSILGSITVGRIAGLIVSIAGSKQFVFKSKDALISIIPKFLALWAILFAISYGLMLYLVDMHHFNVYLSRILVDTTLFVFNFLIQRDLIFARKKTIDARL